MSLRKKSHVSGRNGSTGRKTKRGGSMQAERVPIPPPIKRVREGETVLVNTRQLGDKSGGYIGVPAPRAGFAIQCGAESVFVTDEDLTRAAEPTEG